MTRAATFPPRARPVPRKVSANLEFRRAGARTIVGRQCMPHPFHITLPFHIAGDPSGMATLYMQSSSGGLYGDDALSLHVTVGEAASVHLTTQASTVVHHGRGGEACQTVTFDIGRDGYLEYLPDPAILFAGAALSSRVEIRMAENAVVLLSDSALTHDPEGQGEPFDRYVTEIAILGPDGTACLIERSDVTGADWLRRTRGLPAYGLILVAGVTDAEPLADHIDRALATAAASSVYAVAAALPERGVVVVRFLCATGADLTRMQDVIWHATREALTGHAPARRRK